MINLIDHYANGEKLYYRFIDEVAKKHNLTYMELSILIFLYNNPKYDTASSIINHRHLSKSHVSTSIKSLANSGYIKSEYFEGNKRAIHLKITPKSDEIIKDGLKAQNEFKSLITKGFKNNEIETLLKFISRIDENINSSLKD